MILLEAYLDAYVTLRNVLAYQYSLTLCCHIAWRHH